VPISGLVEMVLDMTSSNLEPVYDIAKYREGDPTILEMRPLPRFVFTSTAALYGEPEYLPMDERHPVEPKSAYTSTKLSAEITIHSYQVDQGLPAVIVRPFNVYGPRQADDFVVSTIVQQVLQGIQLRLRCPSRASSRWCWT
jgi:UDP-glucose 4-epimerase